LAWGFKEYAKSKGIEYDPDKEKEKETAAMLWGFEDYARLKGIEYSPSNKPVVAVQPTTSMADFRMLDEASMPVAPKVPTEQESFIERWINSPVGQNVINTKAEMPTTTIPSTTGAEPITKDNSILRAINLFAEGAAK